MQKKMQAILDTDPAACIQEIINSYPGFLL
jgi:hypothetical protein